MIYTKNLVLSGGHLNGFVYINLFKNLNKYNPQFYHNLENIISISIGSLFGLFYILNIDITNESWGGSSVASFNEYNFGLLFSKYGLNTCNNLMNFLKNILISHKFNPDLTLNDIYLLTNKQLHILCTDTETDSIHSFNKDNNNLRVLDILRMSITIPIVMTIKKYKNKKYVDCALMTNMVNNFILSNKDFKDSKTLWIEIFTKYNCDLYFKNKKVMFFMKIFNYLANKSLNYKKEKRCHNNNLNTYVYIELDSILNIFNLDITKDEYKVLLILGKKIFFEHYDSLISL